MGMNSTVKVRRVYALLNTTQQIVCISGNSPVTQVWNPTVSQYEPSRNITPCVLRPDITAYASDGTWKYLQANSQLADMEWFINGQEISKVWKAGTDYEIVTSEGDDRGNLKIYRNVAVGEQFSLKFKAVIVDYRTKTNVPVSTDEIVMTTVAKADDGYSMGSNEDENIKYNPLIDKLFLYDYKVAHGLIAASDAVRSACINNNAYIRKVSFYVFKGKNKQASGYSVKLFKMNGSALNQLSVGMNEVTEITLDHVTLDLRLVDNATYVIKAYVSNNEVANFQFSVSRIYPKLHIEAGDATDIAPNMDNRKQIAMVSTNGMALENPENALLLKWSTKATDNGKTTTKQWNEGEVCIFDISATGMGLTTDDELEIACDADYKPKMDFFVDGSGNAFVDENGNYLIGN